jgi:hypothetical protein
MNVLTFIGGWFIIWAALALLLNLAIWAAMTFGVGGVISALALTGLALVIIGALCD